MSSEKITFEEHKEFGRLSKIFNDKLVKEGVRIHNEQRTKVIGRKKSMRHSKAEKSLSELRDNLEEIMFKDYPDQATTSIYYGER